MTKQIRCPLCGGRLFDILINENEANQRSATCVVVIKCWKCRQEIKIIYSDLVQTPHICEV